MNESREEPDATGGRLYTIDELAAATGVPSRTIRFYQAKGALPPPTRKGRVAYYGEAHVERLRLVGELQDRGLSLRAIRDLAAQAERSDVSVSEWLGLGDRLRAAFADDRPRLYGEEELAAWLKTREHPGLLAELVRTKLVRREGVTHPPVYLVPSPTLLQLALGLFEAGIDLDVLRRAEEVLRKSLARAASDLAQIFARNLTTHEGANADSIERMIEALRTHGIDAVQLVFRQEVERAVSELVEKGRLMPPRKRAP